jgi:hypothetical protein
MGAHEQFRLSSPNMGLSHLTYTSLEITFEEPISSRMRMTKLMHQLQTKRVYNYHNVCVCAGWQQ